MTAELDHILIDT